MFVALVVVENRLCCVMIRRFRGIRMIESSTGFLCVTVFSISCFLSLSVQPMKTCHSISLSSFRRLHLVLFDRRANHSLLFLGPRTVKQSDIASEPSDISSLPNGKPRPGASGRQILFILFGPLSRRTPFIACNSPSRLSLLWCVCGWRARAYVCICMRACVRALRLLCFLRWVRM